VSSNAVPRVNSKTCSGGPAGSSSRGSWVRRPAIVRKPVGAGIDIVGGAVGLAGVTSVGKSSRRTSIAAHAVSSTQWCGWTTGGPTSAGPS
jgi:hypothetical protein